MRIRVPAEYTVINLGISSDETTLYFATKENMFGTARLKDGAIQALLSTKQQPINYICISVSNGDDRLFFASEKRYRNVII